MREPIDGGSRHGHVEGEVHAGLERVEDQADEVPVAAQDEPSAIGVARSQEIEHGDRATLGVSAGLAAGLGEVRIGPCLLQGGLPVVERGDRQLTLTKVIDELDLQVPAVRKRCDRGDGPSIRRGVVRAELEALEVLV